MMDDTLAPGARPRLTRHDHVSHNDTSPCTNRTLQDGPGVFTRPSLKDSMAQTGQYFNTGLSSHGVWQERTGSPFHTTWHQHVTLTVVRSPPITSLQ